MSTVFDQDCPCTIQELENIITGPACGLKLSPCNAYDEIVDGIFIGEGDSAKSVGCMKRLGITHVLNAAQGKDVFHVNTKQSTYKRMHIQFLGFEATDFINYDLSKHFDQGVDFIEAALASGGKVFVHCVQGVSRSATLVIAYLMIKRHMTVQDATRLVREKREINPNPGFLQQLCNLNEQLKKAGHFAQSKPLLTEKNLDQGMDSLSIESDSQSGASVIDQSKKDNSDEISESEELRSYNVEDLEDILTETTEGIMILPSTEYSQIEAHIYIGEGDLAVRIGRLQRLKITHVLNAAHGKGVDSSPQMYEKAGITFLGIPATDTMGFDMMPYWEPAAEFIHSAVTGKGAVFVHCVQGISRSAALVIAYYMIKCHLPVQAAIRFVRSKREICPNSNFLQQLCDLNNNLKQAGHFSRN